MGCVHTVVLTAERETGRAAEPPEGDDHMQSQLLYQTAQAHNADLIRAATGSRSVDEVPHEGRLARLRQRVAGARFTVTRPPLRPATVESRRPVAP